ncbi:MAG: oligosaccharide flippase family protein [Deltaproteobacteria bacterium]|nr:oligosaccharide flippase family protein [Deltaproteobacteria bacterium]
MSDVSRRFATQALLYFLSNVAVRAVSFVLTPLYTRVLPQEAFGTLAYLNTLGTLLTLVVSCGLGAAIVRFVPEADRKQERTRLLGSIAVFYAIAPLAAVVAIEVAGRAGVLDAWLGVAYDPFLRYIAWAAWLAVFQAIPLQLFAIDERPSRVAALNVASVVAQLSLVGYFVLVRDEGLLGVVQANLWAQAVLACVSLWLVRSHLRLTIDRAWLVPALAYALPLVPHLVSNWVLSISDRLLLARYTDSAQVALYALAYTFNLICVMFTNAVAQALGPHFIREQNAERAATSLPRLGDLCIAATCVVCALVSVWANEALFVLAPHARYEAALAYVPWVVLGALFQGVYFVSSQGSWYALRTGMVPVVTAIAATVNLAGNVVFLPRYGAIAAAVNTAIAYAVMAILHDRLAQRRVPIPWHYARWSAMIAAAALAIGATPARAPWLAKGLVSLALAAVVAWLAWPKERAA